MSLISHASRQFRVIVEVAASLFLLVPVMWTSVGMSSSPELPAILSFSAAASTAPSESISSTASASSFPVVSDLPPVFDSVVVEVGGSDVSIHSSESQASRILDTASPGATFEIIGGIIETEGRLWIRVSIFEGDGTGWIDAGMPSSRPYLMPVSILTRLDVYLRTTPNAGQNDIRRLPTGSSFKPFGASVAADGITWIPVLDQLTGQIGWIGSVAGSPLEWPVGTEMATTIEGLYLRTAASLKSDIVTVLGRGTTLTLLTQPVEHGGEGWLHVRDNTGNEGWILVTDSGPPY